MCGRCHTDSKIILAKHYEDVKCSNTKYVHKFCDKPVVNFIYNFFFICYFCFVSFILNFTFFALESSGKLVIKYSAIFMIALSGSKVILVFKLLILGTFLGPYHRHLLSLSNKSMTSMTYPKSYEFERILYAANSINREKDGYNLILHFFDTSFYSMYIVFSSYIFITGRNDSDQKISDVINNFTIHYPQVSRQKSENPAYLLLSISIVILLALKQYQKSNTIIFFILSISYVSITCLTIRSQCDLENPHNDLKVCGKKYFISCQSLKVCDNSALNNLEMNFILFTIFHTKCKN